MSHKRGPQKSDALQSRDLVGSGSSVDDRRREPRIVSNRTISILPTASAGQQEWKFITVRLLDCSNRGLGLLTDIPFATGDEFMVKVQMERMVLASYTVRHCHKKELRQYIVGAELVGYVSAPGESISLLDALIGTKNETDE